MICICISSVFGVSLSDLPLFVQEKPHGHDLTVPFMFVPIQHVPVLIAKS